MKKLRNYKIIQLILVTILGITGYLIIFRYTTPGTMMQDLIPIYYLYLTFFGCLALLLIGLLIDMLLLSRLENEKQSQDKLSYLDPVTGGLNRYSTDILIRQYETPEKLRNTGCFAFRLTNLTDINCAVNYAEGDRLVRMFYSILEMASNKNDILSRNPPDLFIIFFPEITWNSAGDFLEKISKVVGDYNVDAFDLPIEYSVSYSLNSIEKKETASELISCTIKKLENTKQ